LRKGERHLSAKTKTPFQIFQALLAGSSAEELQLDLLKLSGVAHSALVCTACSLETEIGGNCQARGDEAGRFVDKNYSFYRAGHRAWSSKCPRSNLAGVEHLKKLG